jgi:hypothetical protein
LTVVHLELANSFASIAEALQQLAESDLSMALSQVLHQFSVLSNHEREMQEGQAKLEVTRLLNLADEHVRLIGSVRVSIELAQCAYEFYLTVFCGAISLLSLLESRRTSTGRTLRQKRGGSRFRSKESERKRAGNMHLIDRA